MRNDSYPMPLETIRSRYPRLIRALCWAGCLTEGEAVGAIYNRQIGEEWAGEAVNHFGGVQAVLRAAAGQHVRAYRLRYLSRMA